MGILKPGIQGIIMRGTDFGKKINIDKVDEKFVYFKIKDKQKKIGIKQIFPLK